MSPIGFWMMVIANGGLLILVSYCFFRVLTTPGTEETEHAPLEINTRDAE